MMGQPAIRSKVLFTDWRDVQCGQLRWLTPWGQHYEVGNPPEPQVQMHAHPCCVPHGVRLVAQRAQKIGPVADWRGWGRVIYDQGVYRSWYLEINGASQMGSGRYARKAEQHEVYICQVQSDDGFKWSQPCRCRVDLAGQYAFDGQTFMVDPMASSDERYKFVYCAVPPSDAWAEMLAEYRKRPAHEQERHIAEGKVTTCVFAAVSPDGVAWRPVDKPLLIHHSDTDTTVYWDEKLSKYVMYTRLMRQDRRWVGRTESDDFVQWSKVEPVLWPRLDDPPDRDVYLNGRSEYPGLPEYHLMFSMLYSRMTEGSDVRLHSSADGIAWSQVPGGPVIEPGPPGDWDCEFIGGGKDLVPFGEGRIAIPYTGTCYPHKYPRWDAVWDAWAGFGVRMAKCDNERLTVQRTPERPGLIWVIPVEGPVYVSIEG